MNELPRPPSPYRKLLNLPNFRRLFLAGIASVAGGAIAGICLIWLVFASTGSALDVGLVGAAELSAGVAFSLVGGTLVDRHNRRRLMVLADLGRAVLVGFLVLDIFLQGVDLPVVLLVAFGVQAFSTIFNPAEQTVVPAVVGPGLVADANGLIRSTRSAAALFGTAIAGALIVTLGPVTGLAVNSVTFLVSALLVAGVELSPEVLRPSGVAQRGAFQAELREGFSWLWKNPGLLQLSVSAGFFNFFQTVVSGFLVVYATVGLHGSALLFAALIGLNTAGSGISALAVGRTGAVRHAGRVWVVGYGVVAGSMAVALGFLPTIPVALTAAFILGIAGGVAGTTWLTAAQLTVPVEMQGRYFGIDSLGSWAILPAGQIGGGLLIGAIGVLPTYQLAGVLWVLVGLLFLLPRSLATFGYPPLPGAAAPSG